jgi:hypothetical protein
MGVRNGARRMHSEIYWDRVQAHLMRYVPPLFVGDSVDCIAVTIRVF